MFSIFLVQRFHCARRSCVKIQPFEKLAVRPLWCTKLGPNHFPKPWRVDPEPVFCFQKTKRTLPAAWILPAGVKKKGPSAKVADQLWPGGNLDGHFRGRKCFFLSREFDRTTHDMNKEGPPPALTKKVVFILTLKLLFKVLKSTIFVTFLKIFCYSSSSWDHHLVVW